MDKNSVKIGRGLSDTGDYHSPEGTCGRALDMARQLEAAGLWDGRPVLPAPGAQAQVAPPRGPGCLIVIHGAYDTHRKAPRAGKVLLTPVEKRVGAVEVHAGIHDLIQGQDYEFAARPASSGSGYHLLGWNCLEEVMRCL